MPRLKLHGCAKVIFSNKPSPMSCTRATLPQRSSCKPNTRAFLPSLRMRERLRSPLPCASVHSRRITTSSLRTSKGTRPKNSRKFGEKPFRSTNWPKRSSAVRSGHSGRQCVSCIVSGATSEPALRRCYGPVIGNGRKVAVVIGVSIARCLPSFSKQLAAVGLVRGRG